MKERLAVDIVALVSLLVSLQPATTVIITYVVEFNIVPAQGNAIQWGATLLAVPTAHNTTNTLLFKASPRPLFLAKVVHRIAVGAGAVETSSNELRAW